MSAPMIRFAEFSELWSIRPFGSLGSFKSGTGFPDAEQGGCNGTPFYKVSDMNLPANSDVMQGANHYVTQQQIDRNRWKPITAASIIFAKVGAAIMLERKRKAAGFLIDNNMMAFIPGEDLDYDFCIQLLRNTEFSRYAQTGALPSYNAGDLSGINFIIPSIPEQRRIANALSTVDAKIDLIGRKRDALERFKAGFMQKLFSQEVRFTHEDGSAYPNWEEKTLNELGEFKGGGTPSTKNPEFWQGDIPWVSSQDVIEGDINCLKATRFITEDAIASSPTSLIPADSVLLVTRVGVGKVALNRADVCLSQDFTAIIPSGVNSCFLAYWFQHHALQIASLAQGSTIKGITVESLRGVNVPLPSDAEQDKIASALAVLDDRIKNVKRQIVTIQAFKKGLVQQMFV